MIIFDVETTGTRKDYDQIIELAAQQGFSSDAPRKTWRIKPSVPISPGAQRVHGISMDDLKDCEPFSTHAPKLRRVFEKADVIVGYNVSFDLDMIQAEFQRVGLPLIDFSKKLIIDLSYVADLSRQVESLTSAMAAGLMKDRKGIVFITGPSNPVHRNFVSDCWRVVSLPTLPASWMPWLAGAGEPATRAGAPVRAT